MNRFHKQANHLTRRATWWRFCAQGLLIAVLLATPKLAYAAWTVDTTGGVLTVTSDADDALILSCQNGDVYVNDTGTGGYGFACADVTKIDVTGGPGPNLIDASAVLTEDFSSLTAVSLSGAGGGDIITGTRMIDTLSGGPGDDTLVGGKGNDLISGGPGADELIWRNGDGSDTMDSDEGYDTVHVIGAAGVGDQFAVAPNGARLAFTRTSPGPFTLNVGATERLQIYHGDPDDTVQVHVLTSTQVVIDPIQPITPPTAGTAPLVITGAGEITNTIEAYRLLLGGQNNGGEPGAHGDGYREISWDGMPDEVSAPNFYVSDFFNAPDAPRARGAILNTPGEGLMVSADADNPTGTLPRFGNLNPSYAEIFQVFSADRLFSPVGSNIVDLTFYVAGADTPAVSRGFGAVYTDVDTEHTAFEYFDIDGNSLGKYGTPIADEGLSFLGVIFPEPVVHRVRIHYGTGPLGPNDGDGTDVAVMDNFIYGEPQPVAEPAAASTSELPEAIRAEVALLVAAAPDTPSGISYNAGLHGQAELALTHGRLALDALNAGDLAGGRIHVEHVWNILHGESSELFGDINQDGETQNPGDGYGVRPYAFKIAAGADRIAETLGLATELREAAIGAGICARNISNTWGPAADEEVLSVLAAADVETAKPLGQALVTTLDALYNGIDADGDTQIAAIGAECGVAQVNEFNDVFGNP